MEKRVVVCLFYCNTMKLYLNLLLILLLVCPSANAEEQGIALVFHVTIEIGTKIRTVRHKSLPNK